MMDYRRGYVIITLPKDRLLEHSTDAAAQAECAGVQGRFREMIETLMHDSSDSASSHANHQRIAVIPNKKAFDECLKSALPAKALIRDAALAESVGVGNSPIVVVNNHRLQSVPS